MSRNAALRSICCGLLAVGMVGTVLAADPPSSAKAAAEQLDFGVQMARRGLWNEALFRFEQARQLAPSDVRAWNNLAVAYEAIGRFDDAHAAYREAVRLDPGNRGLKRNVARFLEFYQGFKPGAAAPGAAGAEPPKPGAR